MMTDSFHVTTAAARTVHLSRALTLETALRDDRLARFCQISYQTGHLAEVGPNGCFVEDVLHLLTAKLRSFQQTADGQPAPLANPETAQAITKLEEAQDWLQRRQFARIRQHVFATNDAHQSYEIAGASAPA